MEQENRVRMERIAADPQSGLSAEQVKRRFAQGENNYKVESSTLSVPEIVRSNVCTYFNLVFAVIAVLLAIVGAWSDMLFSDYCGKYLYWYYPGGTLKKGAG